MVELIWTLAHGYQGTCLTEYMVCMDSDREFFAVPISELQPANLVFLFGSDHHYKHIMLFELHAITTQLQRTAICSLATFTVYMAS